MDNYETVDWNLRRFMSPKEFIENHVKGPKGENIKLTSAQCAFLNGLEKYRKKQLKLL